MKRSWRLVAVALLAAVGGCVFDRITLPLAADVVVVHGVLNPGVTDQVALLERALDGQGNTERVPFDSLDPIVSNGGTPIRDARVVVRNSRGDSVVLREERRYRSDGKGAGVYHFANLEGVAAPDALLPNFVVNNTNCVW